MIGSVSSRLLHRVSRIRWLILAFGVLASLAHQLLEGYLSPSTLPSWRLTELVYGVVVSILAWVALSWLHHSMGATEERERALRQAHLELSQANQRLEFLITVNRRLALAEDESELAYTIMDLFMEALPAAACTLIRFNEHRQALPVIHRGELSEADLESRSTHWSSAEVWHQCEQCSLRWPTGARFCPLLSTSFPTTDSKDIGWEAQTAPSSSLYRAGGADDLRLHCLELNRGDHLYGVLSLYLPDCQELNEQEKLLLAMMVNEMSLALESHSLRSRELEMIFRLQGARRLENLHDQLAESLLHAVEALEADGGVLFVTEADANRLRVQAEVGRPLGPSLGLVEGLAKGSGHTETPIIISDLEQAENEQIRSLLIAPLRNTDTILGCQVLWAATPSAFTSRHSLLMAIVSGQAALLIENHRLYLQGEHQAAVAERGRLAREIHDGLAQTLAYLKLRTAQISSRLRGGDRERAITNLDQVQRLLNEAYVDSREAIDGLRLDISSGSIRSWVDQIVSEFEQLSHIPVEITFTSDIFLPAEVQAQLQRIIQETFSNIRKHADATRVWLESQVEEPWLTFQISDNGRGFDPDDIAPIARHGLRIMRERSELLEADLHITSRLDGGTKVTIRLPYHCP